MSNGNSDNVSVIDVQPEQVVDSIFVGLFSRGDGPIGSRPNGLALSEDGTVLYVANGLDNALCVVWLGNQQGQFDKTKVSVKGYIPTEAYPSAAVVNGEELFVTNLEAIGARAAHSTDVPGKADDDDNTVMAYNSHRQMASAEVE